MKALRVPYPTFHLVLGSGFKDSILTGIPDSFKMVREVSFSEVGLHPSTAPGHAGKYVIVEHLPTQKSGYLQVGRLHGYEGLDPRETVKTVMLTRELGVEHYFLTNAAGGIDPSYQPGEAMLILDHINFTGKNPLLGENPKRPDGQFWGPRFPDLTNAYDREWTELMRKNLKAQKLKVHQGVYLGLLGPSFETPAEVQLFARFGAQAVGMSTVWETIALKHSGARVSGLSLISNVAAGILRDEHGRGIELDHFAILDMCKESSVKILAGILNSVDQFLTQPGGSRSDAV